MKLIISTLSKSEIRNVSLHLFVWKFVFVKTWRKLSAGLVVIGRYPIFPGWYEPLCKKKLVCWFCNYPVTTVQKSRMSFFTLHELIRERETLHDGEFWRGVAKPSSSPSSSWSSKPGSRSPRSDSLRWVASGTGSSPSSCRVIRNNRH